MTLAVKFEFELSKLHLIVWIHINERHWVNNPSEIHSFQWV